MIEVKNNRYVRLIPSGESHGLTVQQMNMALQYNDPGAVYDEDLLVVNTTTNDGISKIGNGIDENGIGALLQGEGGNYIPFSDRYCRLTFANGFYVDYTMEYDEIEGNVITPEIKKPISTALLVSIEMKRVQQQNP